MTYNPLTLRNLGAYWVAQGGVNLGVVGNTAHTKGYHLGRDRIYAATGEGDKDYSIRLTRDRDGLTNAASAIDLGRLDGSLAKLYAFSRWLVAEATEDRAKYRDVREVIYSPDGKKVQRWSGVDGGIHTGPGNGDASHITHTHISFFRDSETRDKRALFAGYFAPPPDTGTEDPMPAFEMTDKPLVTGRVRVKSPDGVSTPHAYLNMNTGKIVQADGLVGKWKDAVRVRLKADITPTPVPGVDRRTGWLVGGDAAFLLATDVDFQPYKPEPVPYPVKLSLTVGDKPVSVTVGPLTLP